MHAKEGRTELHRRHDDAVRARCALVPLGLLALAACGNLEIGSYGDAKAANGGTGSGPTLSGGTGGRSSSAGSGSGGVDSGGASTMGGTSGEGRGTGGSAGTSETGGTGGDAGDGDDGSGATGGSTGKGGTGPLSGPLDSADIGDTGAPGTTVFDDGVYTIEASGADIGSTADNFRFLYDCLTGDGQVVARIDDIVAPDSWSKVGVMIRDSLASNAKNAFMLLRPSLGSAFQHRPGTKAETYTTWEESPEDLTPKHNVRYLKPPKWLKLTRQGHTFTAYSSDDGKCWWQRWEQSLAFDDDDEQACFGVALTAAAKGEIATARISNVDVSSAIEPDNAQCERAQADGDIALPLAEDWIVPPSHVGRSGWDYTSVNPNGTPPGVKCEPWEEDVQGAWIAPRKDGPDHPNCPDPQASPAWTHLDYTPDNSWEFDLAAGIGAPPGLASDTLATHVEARGLWLRKRFSLATDLQKQNLMLWGRWADGITVYVNGVLATWNSAGTDEYKYLGLSDKARDALVVGGDNLLAVRLEWDRYDFWEQAGVIEGLAPDRFFDMGLTTNERLAHVPLQRAGERNAAVTVYVDTVKEFVEQQAISGGTFAINKNGAVVASAAFGWHDKNLDVTMARGAKLRLATNEQIITQAAIVKLVNDGVVSPHTLVFPRLGLEPVPGHGKGDRVDEITIEHLRTHTSGIGETTHVQSMLDELAFGFGISSDQWTAEHTARWLYSLNAEVGTSAGSTRDAYFLLRYLAERLVAPQTLEEYLTHDMGLSGIAVSHERIPGREPNEGYVTREPTWDRWLALENYLALSASAEGYASFFASYPLSYELTEEDRYVPIDGGGVIGAMPGTWSVAIEDPLRGLGIVMITNNHGNFDEIVARMNRITYESDPCLFGHEDPRGLLQNLHFIQNVEQPELYVNLEFGLAASSILSGNWSAQWRFEPVDDGYFRFWNRWTEEYLVVTGGVLHAGHLDASSLGADWELVPVGDAFEIRNRNAGEILSVEGGVLTTSTSAPGASADWRFCN